MSIQDWNRLSVATTQTEPFATLGIGTSRTEACSSERAWQYVLYANDTLISGWHTGESTYR